MQRTAEDRLADRAAGLGEGIERAASRHIAGLEMYLGNPPIIARQKADQHIGEVIAGLPVEPAHDAEIDHRERAVRIDEQIAGMLVGVKKSVAEHLLEKRRRGVAQQIGDRMAGGDQRAAVVDPDAGDPLGGQHAMPGAPPIDLRYAKARIAGEVFAQLGSGRRLVAQIHLDLDRLRQRLDHLDRLQAAQRRPGALDQPRQPQEQVEIASEGAGDARPQHLDRDLLPLGRHREMDLRDRCRGDCGLVEGGEQAGEGLSELGLDQRAGLRPWKRRQAVLQPREVFGDLVAQKVGAGRQDLAELDEARTHLAERGGQTLAGPRRCAAASPKEAGHLQPRGGRRDAVAKGQDRKQRVVPRQNHPDPGKAGEVADAAQEPEHERRTIRAARPNGAPRCRRSDCGSAHAPTRPPRSSPPAHSASESGGCSRRDKYRRRDCR